MQCFKVKLKAVAAEDSPFSPFLTMEVICTGYTDHCFLFQMQGKLL